MAGDFQKEFTHEIPPSRSRSKQEKGCRYSFTFRKHLV